MARKKLPVYGSNGMGTALKNEQKLGVPVVIIRLASAEVHKELSSTSHELLQSLPFAFPP
jgi:hypothetical protein